MKRNIFKTFVIGAMALAGLTACNMSEIESVNRSGDRIDFLVTTSGMTKAVDVTTANLTGFTVEAFNHNTVTAPYMNAVAFTGGNGTFASATPYYWPQGALDFYAYSQGAATGQVQKTDYRTFTVTPAADPAAQVDFVFAGTTNKTKAGSTSGAIPLNFRHTESKVKVQVKNTAANLKFVIDAWKVGYLDNVGTFTYNSNETNPYDATTDGTGTLNRGMWSGNTDAAAANGYTNTLASSVNVAANAGVAALAGEMILIPQATTVASEYATATSGSATNGSYVALKIKILNRENDAVIYSNGEESAWAIWPVAFDWELGKCYTYTVDLAGGGYYETNHDANTDLDPILEGAVISFASVTVDDFSAQSSTELIVKTDPTLRFECENANYPYNEYAIVSWDPNRPINFTVKLPSNATGSVTTIVDGLEYTSTVTDGQATFSIPDLEMGNHTVDILYSGDEHYNDIYTSATIGIFTVHASVEDEHGHRKDDDSYDDDLCFGDELNFEIGNFIAEFNDPWFKDFFKGLVVIELDNSPFLTENFDEWKAGGSHYNPNDRKISLGNSLSLGEHSLCVKWYDVQSQSQIATATPVTTATTIFNIVNP